MIRDYLTIKQFCKKYSGIMTEGSLRWILRQEKFNGSSYFYRRLGKKVLISEQLFFEWLDYNPKITQTAEKGSMV